MSFFETPRFPDSISYGASGGPEYSTNVLEFPSGGEHRNQNWSAPKLRWDVAHGLKVQSDMDTLIAFFRSCKGKAHGFRFKDWSDFQVTVSNGRLGTTDGLSAPAIGSGLPTYLLYKRYSAGQTEDRSIKKPVSGTVTVYRGGNPVTVGVAAGNISIDYTTGVITFVANDVEAITGHTVGASHQFTTATDIPTLAIGEKVYLSGITGTAATVLNGIAHTISNKAGAGPYTWTISTATTGLTVTGNGSAYEYPQATDTLTWAGQFDVPCRFDTDSMRIGLDTYNRFDWNQIPVVELRQP